MQIYRKHCTGYNLLRIRRYFYTIFILHAERLRRQHAASARHIPALEVGGGSKKNSGRKNSLPTAVAVLLCVGEESLSAHLHYLCLQFVRHHAHADRVVSRHDIAQRVHAVCCNEAALHCRHAACLLCVSVVEQCALDAVLLNVLWLIR